MVSDDRDLAMTRDYQRLIEFVLRRFPQAQAEHAIMALAGGDPDHGADWWAARVEHLMRIEDRPADQRKRPYPDPAVAQRAFDDTDRRMRAARWDDMRGWRQAQGIGA